MSQKSTRFHAAGLPQAVHTYSLRASYHFANDESARCGESDRPACARRQPEPRALVSMAPRTDLFHGSSDSAHQAFVVPDHHPPTPSTDVTQACSCDTV